MSPVSPVLTTTTTTTSTSTTTTTATLITPPMSAMDLVADGAVAQAVAVAASAHPHGIDEGLYSRQL